MDPRKESRKWTKEKEKFNLSVFLEETVPDVEITSIGFNTYDLYNSEVIENSIPILIDRVSRDPTDLYKTIYDPRLGVIGVNDACQSCNLVGNQCPGHLGLIKLEKSVINPLFVRDAINVLSSVCQGCGGLLLNRTEIKENGIDTMKSENRLKNLSVLSDRRVCTNRECKQLKAKKYSIKKSDLDRGLIIYKELLENKKTKKYSFSGPDIPQSVEAIGMIFNYISDEDAYTMGLDVAEGSHPRNTIMNYVIVPAPCIRTNNIVNGRIKSDKIGMLYENIIKANIEIVKFKESNKLTKLKEKQNKLTGFVRDLIMKSEGNAHDKSVTKTIQGKKGLFRKSLLGARANYSGRSVASHDPYLPFWKVGIPLSMAKELTYPVSVTNENKNILTKYLRQGKVVSVNPGHKSVYSDFHGLRMRVTERIRKNYRLTNGDIVNRWLSNGDYIIVNRQPTLHKYGMLGFEAYILPPGHQTIHVNINATTPFNLDFDGDEVNVHVPQTAEAQNDVRTKMFIKNCVKGGHKNQLYVKLTYKSIETLAAMTADDVFVDQVKWGNIVAHLDAEKIRDWVHRVLRSDAELLPRTFHNLFLNEFDFVRRTLVDKRASKKLKVGLNKILRREDVDVVDLVNTAIEDKVIPTLITEDLSLFSFIYRFGVFSGRNLFSAVLPGDFNYRSKGVVIINGFLVSGVIDKSHIGSSSGSIADRIHSAYGNEVYSQFLDDLFKLLNGWNAFQGLTVGLEDCLLQNPKSEELIQQKINEIKLEVRTLRSKKTGDPIEDAKIEDKIKDTVASFTQVSLKVIKEEGRGSSLIQMQEAGAKGSIVGYSKISAAVGQIFSQGGFPKCNISRGTRSTFYQHFGSDNIEDRGFCTNSFAKGLNPIEMIYVSLSGVEGLLGGLTKTPESGDIFRKIRIYLQGMTIHPDGSVRDEQNNIIQTTYGYDGIDPEQAVVIKLLNQKQQTFTYMRSIVLSVNQDRKYGGVKKRLNPRQIQRILDQLPRIKSSFIENIDLITANFKFEIRKFLESTEIKEKAIPRFVEILIDDFNKTRVKINSRIGSTSSEALTGDATQSALDSKKNTGTTKRKLGPLDTLKEIATVTENTKDPKTRVYFNFGKTPVNFNTIQDKITNIVELTLEKLVLYDSDVENPKTFFEGGNENFWYDAYTTLNGVVVPETDWFLRLALDVELMFYYKVTPQHVYNKVKSGAGNLLECVLSPILERKVKTKGSIGDATVKKKLIYLDVYPKSSYEALLKKIKLKPKYKQISRISQIFLQSVFIPEMSKMVIAGISGIQYLEISSTRYDMGITTENKIANNKYRIYNNYGWSNYNALSEDFLLDLFKNVGLKVKPGRFSGNRYFDVISKQRPSEYIFEKLKDLEKKDTDYAIKQNEKREKLMSQRKISQAKKVSYKPPSVSSGRDLVYKVYYASLDGTNLGQLLLLSYIDSTRTFSYDINEMYFYYGIGVVRNLIIFRLHELFQSLGTWIDPKHIIIFADYMCFHGSPKKVGYYGSQERSVLVKASLGSQMKVLQEAALYGQKDPVTSVPSSVIVGKKLRKFEEDAAEVGGVGEDFGEDDEDLEDIESIVDMLENFNNSEFEDESLYNETIGQVTETVNLEKEIKPEEERGVVERVTEREIEERVKKLSSVLLEGDLDFQDIGSNLIISCPVEEEEYTKESIFGGDESDYVPR